jgi:hypothetical protein
MHFLNSNEIKFKLKNTNQLRNIKINLKSNKSASPNPKFPKKQK